jgi:hypothetical protein
MCAKQKICLLEGIKNYKKYKRRSRVHLPFFVTVCNERSPFPNGRENPVTRTDLPPPQKRDPGERLGFEVFPGSEQYV